ncbi:MAG: protein kinase domain-containing protein [Planctomycetota bacterium]
MEGTRLGPYRVVSELGSGGMGTVYLAEAEGEVRGLTRGARVALKVVHPHLLASEGYFKRFLREAEIGRKVRHENVVRTYDADAILHEGKQINYLVMEYVAGQTLRFMMNEMGTLSEELCRHIGCEVAKALRAIHEVGVVHRDLKPENVLVTEDHVVKVMDLGVARIADEAMRLSHTGAFLGSVLYAAPEHVAGEEPDGRADLYSLGLILYELVTGRHPFAGTDLVQTLRRRLNESAAPAAGLNPQITPLLEEVIHALLEKDRGQRLGSAALLHTILEQGEESEWWLKRASAIRSSTRRPLRRVRVPRETALYGREGDLERLRSLFESAKEGRGQALLIEGEAGIGKTRLVDEFVGRLQQEGEDLNFLFGSYPPGGAATAAGAFSTAYREQFGRERLSSTLAGYMKETPILIPAFAALLRGEPPPPESEPLSRDSIQTVFVQVTQVLAEERPTIVLIDDLHFAPEEGRALFASLTLSLLDRRVLLIGTLRSEVSEKWLSSVKRIENASWFSLGRLGPKEVGELLVDAFRSERVANELGWEIAQKSDGNPFFLFEILRDLREKAWLEKRSDGTWITTEHLRNLHIPASILELIQARIARLDDEERGLLEVASCCGFEFDPLLVADAMGMDALPALKRLGQIEKAHRLIRAAGRRYVFDHHQVQETLYDALFELLREEYHVALGHALERRSKAEDREGATAVDLCRHFFVGKRGSEAMPYFEPAFNHLKEGHLSADAIDLAKRALETEDLVTGRERVSLMMEVTDLMVQLGRYAEMEPLFEVAIALANELEDALLKSRTHRVMGLHHVRQARPDEAESWLQKALQFARVAGDKGAEAKASGALGNLRRVQGRLHEAIDYQKRDRDLHKEIGDLRGEAVATGNIGVALGELGRTEDSRRYYERSLHLVRKAGLTRNEATLAGNLGIVYHDLGRWAAAKEHYERAMQISTDIGYRAGQAIALTNLGVLMGQLGQQVEAQQRLRRSVALCQEAGLARVEGYGLHRLGWVAAQWGEAEEAERFYDAALDLRRRIFYTKGIAETLTDLAELESVRGNREQALDYLNEALEMGRKISVPAVLLLALARIALLRDGEESLVAEALEHEQDSPYEQRMRARYWLWLATKDRAHLEEAHRILTHLREHAPEEYRNSMVDDVSLHRAIWSAVTD